MTDGIDIVIPWVDGSDRDWLAAKESAENGCYCNAAVATGGDENASEIRYRDWGTLPYFFRGVERFAPWVRRIHFVTWGHLPGWLDTSNPKIRIVRHGDYIPAEYLPTFASRPIELNAHRIEGLSDRFIMWNDDMFLCRPVPQERFFREGLPCDMARLSLITGSSISHTVLNMTEILNRRHDRRHAMRENRAKWYSPKYGFANILKTLDLSVWKGFAGLADTHMPQPYLKEIFMKLWNEEFTVLDTTCRMRFRSPLGVSHWLMRYEQLATGGFSPVSFRDAHLDSLCENRIGEIEEYIRTQRYAMICLNDSPQLENFDRVRARLAAALESILPAKSSYER